MAKDKSGDFERLSAKRLPNVLEAIRIYGHLANKGAYSWTDEQLAGQLGQIDTAVAELRASFGVPNVLVVTRGPTDIEEIEMNLSPLVEDPEFTLAAWKEDRITELAYPEWVAEKREIEAVVPDFIKKDWKK